MTWETEEESDALSQSNMTTDTYGYGGDPNNHDQSIIWSDDPERAYFKSMVQGEDDQLLIGDSTVNELMNTRHRDSILNLGGDTPRNNVDSSGLSMYDTENEDDTIARIEATADDSGWFASKRQQRQAAAPLPLQIPYSQEKNAQDPTPSSAGMAFNFKSPVSALTPTDQAGEGMANTRGYAVPNPDLVPTSPGRRPVAANANQVMADLEGYGEDGKIIPGYIFVTQGQSSSVHTKQLDKKRRFSRKGKAAGVPQESREADQEQVRKRKYCLCKLGLLFLLAALSVGIVMLSMVYINKRNNDRAAESSLPDEQDAGGTAPALPPNFFAPRPTGTPTSPPRNFTTVAPSVTPIVATSAPAVTTDPAVTSSSPTVALGSPETATPTSGTTEARVVDQVKDFVVAQFPDSAAALEDTSSAQYQALEWIVQDLEVNRRIRGLRRLQSMDSRLMQRWALAALFFSTGGHQAASTPPSAWIAADGWLTFPDECRWEFITCNDAGEVSEIFVADNGLIGRIPPEIGVFANSLTQLTLSGNELEGRLPTTIGLLRNLFRLSALGNQLSGPLPSEVGSLSELRFCALSRNTFSGPIPSTISGLVNLRTLDLALTSLSGSIPSELAQLSFLQFVSFGSTSISGTIPSELGTITTLNQFKVARTSLSGAVPAGFCSGNLEFIELKADCSEIDCPCCTICCVDGGRCVDTTPAPTASSIVSPTLNPTSVTESPIPKELPLNDQSEPPATIAVEATAAPTPVLVPATNSPAVSAPSGTIMPTFCEATISTNQECYENGQDIIVSFENCDARLDDWVGVYASGQADLRALDEPIAWLWTAGDQFIQVPVASGSVVFPEARGTGNFQMVIARNRQAPPYRAYGVSSAFRLSTDCSVATTARDAGR